MKKMYLFLNLLFALEVICCGTTCDTTDVFGKQWITCVTNNCPEDSIQITYEEGVLKRAKKYFSCRDSGMFIYFSEKGDTLTKSFFVGKRTVGIFRQWFVNGKSKTKAYYNDQGKKHGLEESWHEDGTRKDSIVNDNGNIIEIRAFFNIGKVRYWIKKMDPNSGKKETGVFYDPKGKICGEIKKGNGTYILWSEDTKERWIETYKDGEEVSSRKLADSENPSWK